MNLESLLLKVRNVLDVDFILEGVHIFLGAFPGVYVSTEVKNTWMIKAIIQYPGMDSITLLNAFLEDFEGWTKRDFASCHPLILGALKFALLKRNLFRIGSEPTAVTLGRMVQYAFNDHCFATS